MPASPTPPRPPGRPRGTVSPRATARRAEALQLRLAGVEWQTIADRLGYRTKGAACQDVARALDANAAAAARIEDLRLLELARLDRMQVAVWAKAMAGDTKAIDVILRLMDRRARLTGLHNDHTEAASAVDAWLDHMGVA